MSAYLAGLLLLGEMLALGKGFYIVLRLIHLGHAAEDHASAITAIRTERFQSRGWDT